jgi:hypothetical protein
MVLCRERVKLSHRYPAKEAEIVSRRRPVAAKRLNLAADARAEAEAARRPLALLERRFSPAISIVWIGGAAGNRTPDLCSAIAALSHLSYSPVPSGWVHATTFCVNRMMARGANFSSTPLRLTAAGTSATSQKVAGQGKGG